MRVFVAGATGAIGRPLMARLVDAGHEVWGMTRSPQKGPALEQAGARPVVCDALDRAAVVAAVGEAKPDVVVHQLTDLPRAIDLRRLKQSYAANDRIRREGTPNLLDAARAAGARRVVAQSIAFLYAPVGGMVKAEDDPVWEHAPEPLGESLRTMLGVERAVLGIEGIEGIVLRYGFFYGPGTFYAADGSTAEEVRARRYPVVGSGEGTFSFIHVDDAAAATVAALERGAPGLYNVVDDEPAPVRDWLPVYAAQLGAKRPLRVPSFVARIAAGRFAVTMSTQLRGATNAKARRELGWEPRYRSWRDGFAAELGGADAAAEAPVTAA